MKGRFWIDENNNYATGKQPIALHLSFTIVLLIRWPLLSARNVKDVGTLLIICQTQFLQLFFNPHLFLIRTPNARAHTQPVWENVSAVRVGYPTFPATISWLLRNFILSFLNVAGNAFEHFTVWTNSTAFLSTSSFVSSAKQFAHKLGTLSGWKST